MSTKNLELPYICINCAEHPTNVPAYFNPSLKSNFNFWVTYASGTTSILRGYCSKCEATVEFTNEDQSKY